MIQKIGLLGCTTAFGEERAVLHQWIQARQGLILQLHTVLSSPIGLIRIHSEQQKF